MPKSALALAVLLASAQASALEVPLDVGVGPAGYWFVGPLLENRGGLPHFALHLDLAAILDHDFIMANRDRVPAQYRAMASSVREARVGPSIFIPSALIISPKVDALGGVGVYGVSWTPFGLILVNAGGPRGHFSIDAKLLLTTMVIHSDLPQVPLTFFLRPGIQLQVGAELAATERFLISLELGAQAYIPQKLGEFGFGPLNESISFAFFAALKFHVRFPYELSR